MKSKLMPIILIAAVFLLLLFFCRAPADKPAFNGNRKVASFGEELYFVPWEYELYRFQEGEMELILTAENKISYLLPYKKELYFLECRDKVWSLKKLKDKNPETVLTFQNEIIDSYGIDAAQIYKETLYLYSHAAGMVEIPLRKPENDCHRRRGFGLEDYKSVNFIGLYQGKAIYTNSDFKDEKKPYLEKFEQGSTIMFHGYPGYLTGKGIFDPVNHRYYSFQWKKYLDLPIMEEEIASHCESGDRLFLITKPNPEKEHDYALYSTNGGNYELVTSNLQGGILAASGKYLILSSQSRIEEAKYICDTSAENYAIPSYSHRIYQYLLDTEKKGLYCVSIEDRHYNDSPGSYYGY